MHLRQRIPLPLSWPCQPCMIFRGTLDSRWVKLRFWEHHHSDCCPLKICGFLRKKKPWLYDGDQCFHSAATRWLEFRLMIAPGNSWKEQGCEEQTVFFLWSPEPYPWPLHLHLQALLKYSCGSHQWPICQTAHLFFSLLAILLNFWIFLWQILLAVY